MHASSRHRSAPGNGFRPNSVGMAPPSSRMSPDGTFRSNLSLYRNFNRYSERDPAKPYNQPQQLSRRDVFTEAGRLAAEYLVSQGLLSATALSRSSKKKKHAMDFQEFKPKEDSGLRVASEGGRLSALARLGNVVPDTVSSHRRFADEFNSAGSRSNGKGRRKMRFSGIHGSSWSRPNERDYSCSDKSCPPIELKRDLDNASAFDEEKQVDDGIDAGFSMSAPLITSRMGRKGDDVGDLGSKSDVEKFPGMLDSDICLKDPSTTAADVVGALNTRISEAMEGTDFVGGENQSTTRDMQPRQHSVLEGSHGEQNDSNLVQLCRFVDMPKRTRSSMMRRGTKGSKISITGLLDIPDPNTSMISGLSVESYSVDCSLADPFSNQTETSKGPETGIPKPTSVVQNKCTRSHSFPDGSSIHNQNVAHKPPGSDLCTSLVVESGEEHDALHITKRAKSMEPREWLSSLVILDDESTDFSNSSVKGGIPQDEGTLHNGDELEVVNHDAFDNIASFSLSNDMPCIEYAEEKQGFSNSFKICDLNLVDASDMNENCGSDQILTYHSMLNTKKECPVSIELSMGNGCNISNELLRHAADVELISLEDDSLPPDDKTLSNSEKKEGNAFSAFEGFRDNLSTSDDINDAYGLMVPDFLRTDITSCSSVSEDIISLHSGLSLHNGEGILEDDDLIYMSLDEIPISMPDI